jgi:hypothetical protein
LVDVFHHAAHGIDRRADEDAVPQVEDVTWITTSTIEDEIGSAAELLPGREERRGIEVALYADRGPEHGAGAVERHAPVETQDVGAGRGQAVEPAARIARWVRAVRAL